MGIGFASSTERAGRAYQSMSASPLKRPDGLARAKCREGPEPDSCTAAKKLDRPELVIAALRAAGSVVEVRPLVTAVHHRGESVVRVHDGFDENQRVVRRGESILQVLYGLDDERSCPGVATEHLRQIGIGPVGDVVVGLGLPEIAAFDRVSAVVDQEDYRFVVVSQDGRQLLRRDLERTVAYEQNVTAFRRRGQCAEQGTDRIADRPPVD